MDCERFRAELLSDPADDNPALQAHEAACGGCAAYAQRARRAEALIARALRFDVTADKAAQPAPVRKRWPRLVPVGMAAAIVAAVILGVGQGLLRPTDTMEGDVLEHWQHEPYSWVVTDQPVDSPKLRKAIAGKVVLDESQLPTITYAHSCFFRGKWVPHLVVQGKQGPVMVMLLPSEEIGKPMTVEFVEENLEGIVMPHGQGSIAIVGVEGESLQSLQQSLSRAVEWSI